jgi:DNA-binding FadR family transcriptional regulator
MSLLPSGLVPTGRLHLGTLDTQGGAEHAAIAKTSPTPWRLGQATAMALEDSLQRQGWPEGAVCEPEKTMAARFGVGVRLMRQAFRILQSRGAIRPQRGRRGGLVVLRPDLEEAATALADNLRWSGVTNAEINEARALLEPLAARGLGLADDRMPNVDPQDIIRLNPGLALALACFRKFPRPGAPGPLADVGSALGVEGGYALGMHSKTDDVTGANMATRVAWRIGQEITHELCRSNDRLGSLWDLAGRYEVSLAIVIDAVRILEDADVVACIRGRTGGVTLKLPNGDAVISAVHGYLAASATSADHCVSICHQLNTRAACGVAEARAADALAEVQAAYDRMRAATGEEVMRAWYELQKLLHDRAGNRALHLITRCLAAYCVRTVAVDALPAGPQFLDRMVRTTGVMVAAILAGDVAGAAKGQALTRQVLDERSPVDQASAA